MTNPTTLTVPERIACAICWLSRQGGLPMIADLRTEVTQRHRNGCQWCEFPLAELVKWCSLEAVPGVPEFARLSSSAQRRLVIKAMGIEQAEAS